MRTTTRTCGEFEGLRRGGRERLRRRGRSWKCGACGHGLTDDEWRRARCAPCRTRLNVGGARTVPPPRRVESVRPSLSVAAGLAACATFGVAAACATQSPEVGLWFLATGALGGVIGGLTPKGAVVVWTLAGVLAVLVGLAFGGPVGGMAVVMLVFGPLLITAAAGAWARNGMARPRSLRRRGWMPRDGRVVLRA